MRSIIGIGLLGMIFLSSCVFLDDSFHKKELVSFALRTADNPELRLDYSGAVEVGKIRINVPDYVDATRLVPLIEWDGLALQANGRSVSEATRAQDFTQPLVYSVLGKDRERRDYQVVVTRTPASSNKALNFYAVAEEYATPYGSYYTDYYWRLFYPDKPEYVGMVDFYSTLERTRLYVSQAGIEAKLDGGDYSNDGRLFDVRSELTLTVVAEDLSTQDYPIRVQRPAELRATVKNGSFTVSIGWDSSSQTIELDEGADASQCYLWLAQSGDRFYPVTTDEGDAVPFETWVPFDLSSPVRLTVSGPFLSKTYTISASVAP